ncbi:MAG: helix-turn-helix domain-containing protein [Collinsella sp.]
MLERRASCREIARELGRSPSTVSAEVASHRFVTAPKARRGERVDASADLSAACPRLAAWPALQRVRPVPRDRLQAPSPRLLRGPGRAAVRRLGARFVQARDRRRRARRGGQAGDDKGLPAPGALPRADGGAQRRPGGPVAVDHLPLGLGGLRRHDQHGAQAQGRLQAEEERRGPGGDAPLRPQVACRVPRPRGGRVRRGLGDGHGRGRAGGLRRPAHAAAPPQQAPARAAAGGEDRGARRGRPGRYQGGPRRRRHGQGLPRRAHRQRRRVLRRGGDRGAARRGAGRRRGCSTATPGAATRRAPASATTSRSGSCCPRAPESGSTGSSRRTWRWPCRT